MNRRDSCQEAHAIEIPDQQLRDYQQETLTAESFVLAHTILDKRLASIKVMATKVQHRRKC